MREPVVPGVEINAELGRGAHSVVYRGHHQASGQACAVKLPLTRARWTRWIYREAVALARVHHAKLPAVLEVGEVDGLPYLVMEIVEGRTLAEILERETIGEEAAVTYALDLTDALAAVHDAGLVHRDVKPRNVIVTSGGAVKLVDFGFATPMERTGVGETAGTAAYAAPEQLTPPGRVDHRVDLYGLGRILLECLNKELFTATRADRTRDVCSELLRNGTDPQLAEIVGALLKRDPAQRYPSARALATDLRRHQRGLKLVGAAASKNDGAPAKPVARTAELALVTDLIRGVNERGTIVVLEGTRGSGKSQLLEAISSLVSDRVFVSAVASRDGDPPLALLRRALEACVSKAPGGSGLTHRELAELAGTLAPILQLVAPGLLGEAAPTREGELPLATDALVEGAAEFMLRVARKLGKLAVIADDAHWMDEASANALLRLAHRVGEAPITLVIAGRREARSVARRFAELGAAEVPLTAIELSPLNDDGIERVVCSYLATGSIDRTVIRRIVAMADGTPLGALEVLGAYLDAGVLRPHLGKWRFDEASVQQVELPTGARALLGRRLLEVPKATRRVLEAAAVIGSIFEEALVAKVLELSSDTSGYALVSARRSGVVEETSDGRYRFVHDSLRETLLDELSAAPRADLHHRIALVLASEPNLSFELLCRAARHFAAGHPERDPAIVYRVAAAGARAALEHYDDETAIALHAQACAAAAASGIEVSTALDRVEAEAQLRFGAIGPSIAAFERALRRTTDSRERAEILGRIAWAYQVHAEPEKAWSTLSAAFREIGERLPVEDVSSAASTTVNVLRARVRRGMHRASNHSPAETDLLCRLHYQNTRLGLEYGKTARLLQSGLAGGAMVGADTPPATRARALAVQAFIVMALGGKELGIRGAREALEMAKHGGDPTIASFCTQMLAMVTSWAGRIDEALVAFRTCLDEYGPWNEASEYCITAMSGAMMLSTRGDASEAAQWNERAVARLRRGKEFPRVAISIIHDARASLAALELTPEPDSWLAKQFVRVPLDEMGQGFHRILSWGPRAAYYLATGELGPEFEALVSAFEAEKHNPKTVHMAVGQYYVAVAHARMQQCFRGVPAGRARDVANLASAAKSLRAFARISVLEAHASLAEGVLAWLHGSADKATRLLADADALARRESAPWVLSGVARARAHILSAVGRTAAAHDQARIAYALAVDHGAAARARAIREEFPILAPPKGTTTAAPSVIVTSRRSSSSRTHRQLAALLQLAKWPRRELRAEQQAASILDELISVLGAARAAIWFQPDAPAVPLGVARHRSSVVSTTLAPDSARGTLLRRVQQSGEAWPVVDGSDPPIDSETPIDRNRALVVPLFLYEAPIGALSIERASSSQPFGSDEREMLDLLSHQVPIALEVARLLHEREQLTQSLQQSQKMQAIGQLAGGLAHDFNNMLAAMKVALSVAQERAADDETMRDELDVIAEATTRAAQLTQQLLSFARSEPLPVKAHEINQLVSAMEPMLRRVVNPSIEIVLRLSPVVDSVEIDSASFDQALMNLCINARDAMPFGGKFTVSTKSVVLDENAAIRADVKPGSYVEVEVTDTGEGMSPETQQRIFEPFFTTKAVGRGTGLGLASVYTFVKNCGGGITVQSERGVGTTFTLYLRRAERPRMPRRRAATTNPSTFPPSGTPDTILVVDDDDLVRRSIAKILERNGYRVVAASGSVEALDVVRSQQGKRIGLVIMDVLLPGVTGPELGRRLNDIVTAKVLFVSGFSADSAPIEDAKVRPEMLLQKPFTQSALLARVRELMPS